MAKILLVEDEVDFAKPIFDWLSSKHYTVECCHNFTDAEAALQVCDFDLVILDWNLPGGSGVSLLRNFRARGGATPVLMITANGTIDEKEEGFRAGSDDYLTKPFNLRELSVRVEALLRRPSAYVGSILQAGALKVDPSKHRAFRGEQELDLLPKEFALLEFFLRHPDQVFSAEALLQRVWISDADVTPATVVTTIKRLRKKIDTEHAPSFIENVFSIGYRLRLPKQV